MIDVKKHNITVTTTILGQALSAIATVFIVMVVILGTIIYADLFENSLHWLPYLAFELWLVANVAGLTVLIRLENQFDASLSAWKMLKTSIPWAIVIGIVLNVIFYIAFSQEPSEYSPILANVFIVQLFPLINAVVLFVCVALWHKLVNYDSEVHQYLISWEMVLDECRNGNVPYVYQVKQLWSAFGYVMSALWFISIMGMSYIPVLSLVQLPIPLLGLAVIYIFYRAVVIVNSLWQAEIQERVETYIDSERRGGARSIKRYYITTDKTEFETSKRVYQQVSSLEKMTIKIWYVMRGRQEFIVAFEPEKMDYQSKLEA